MNSSLNFRSSLNFPVTRFLKTRFYKSSQAYFSGTSTSKGAVPSTSKGGSAGHLSIEAKGHFSKAGLRQTAVRDGIWRVLSQGDQRPV